MKFKKEFKVGDRVSVSGYCLTPCKSDQSALTCNHHLYNKAKGTIKSISPIPDFSYSISVILDQGKKEVNCHIRQLAPLKKKICRRLFIDKDIYERLLNHHVSACNFEMPDGSIEQRNTIYMDKIYSDNITPLDVVSDKLEWLEFKEVKKCK